MRTISEVISVHRVEQYEEVIRAFGRKVIEEQSVESALKEFLPKTRLRVLTHRLSPPFLKWEEDYCFKKH